MKIQNEGRFILYIMNISINIAGGWCFLRNLIGSSISECPALFTSKQNKMASSYIYVTEEELFFIKRSHRVRQHQKNNLICQLSVQRHVLYVLAINVLRMCFKMLCLQMMSGRQTDIP